MLIHELLHEEMLHERRESLRRLEATSPHPSAKSHSTFPRLVRTLVPAFTHGLFGLPAPPRAAGHGC